MSIRFDFVSSKLSVRHALVASILVTLALSACPNTSAAGVAAALASAMPTIPTVFSLSVVRAERVAILVRTLFPRAVVRIDRTANAVVVIASADEVTGIRAVITGIDIRDPSSLSVEAVQLHTNNAAEVVNRLRPVFPKSRFVVAPNKTVVVEASTSDLTQIKAVIAAIDTLPVAPTPQAVYPTQSVRVLQADPHIVARAIARSIRAIRVSVAGTDILVNGSPEDIAQAKTLASALDHPDVHAAYAQIYRLHAIDAGSVVQLLSRSFRGVDFTVDRELNAITVVAIAPSQSRIADAIAQLDVSPNAPGSVSGGSAAPGGPSITEVVTLRAAVPAINGQASTSAADIAQSVSQAVGAQAADLKIIVHPNSTRLILTGSSYSVGLAKDLIAKLDIAEPLVELDTEVYEVDEGSQKQLGLKFPTAALSTTYSEVAPQPNASGVSSPINGFQPLGRTPLSLQAQLDLLVSTNHARILEDPRITTFSGRTASLRAGETVNVLTTAGGGSGTVATTQIQSFQTGVTLDITPVVNTDDYVTVTLHPSVNTEAGISAAGVPNIQNRDTTTTVGLHDGETIVVGGLIEDTNSRTVQKIPVLGDLPLIGRLFQDVGTSHTRNELIVTVTPHILKDGFRADIINRDLPIVPTAAPLPRLAAEATLPPKRSRAGNVPAPVPVAPQAPLLASETPLPRPVPTPAAVPSAFSQTNVFTYGSPPPNNYADASQAPQLFFVQAKPTVVRIGQLVTISAVSTSNVSSLTFGSSAADTRQSLGAIGTGKWQGTVTVNPNGTALGSSNVIMFLTATTSSGATVSQQIPFSLEK